MYDEIAVLNTRLQTDCQVMLLLVTNKTVAGFIRLSFEVKKALKLRGFNKASLSRVSDAVLKYLSLILLLQFREKVADV